MPEQTIIWTALPNGVTGTGAAAKLRVSVFVSPQLKTATGLPRPNLSQFPDFLDWPRAVAGATFKIRFGAGAPVDVKPIAQPTDPPPSDIWKSIFDASTYVKPYKFPKTLAARPLLSFPVANLHSRVKELYQEVAIGAPRTPPVVGPELKTTLPLLEGLANQVGLAAPVRAELMTRMRTQLQAAPNKVLSAQVYQGRSRIVARAQPAGPVATQSLAVKGVTPAAVDFHQAVLFHAPMAAQALPRPNLQAMLAGTDFHEIVAHLGQYPLILRRVGLVLDFEVPLAGVSGATTVAVIPTFSGSVPTTNVSPRLHCTVGGGSFVAASKSAASDVAKGWVKLNDDSRFDIGQVDVDGAALKMVRLADTMRRFTLMRTVNLVPKSGAAPGAAGAGAAQPAARGQAGLRRAQPAARAEAGAATPPAPAEPESAALPALRNAGIWIARDDRAAILKATMLRAETLSDNVAQKKDSTPELWAEDVIRGYRLDVWDEKAKGWFSLHQRVGTYRLPAGNRTIPNQEDEGWVTMGVSTESSAPGAPARAHEIIFRWEGWSLAAARPGQPVPAEGTAKPTGKEFGMDVTFRAKPGSLPRLRYGNDYRLRARVVDLAGNSLPLADAGAAMATETITYTRHDPLPAPVVLPNSDLSHVEGESVAHLVIRSMNDAPPKDKVRTTADSRRHVLPPSSSQLEAELHGMFDSAGKVKGDAATYNLITSNDGVLPDFVAAPQVDLPYLPDALAFGATIQFELVHSDSRDKSTQVVQVPFGGTWPDVPSFRIVLYESPTPDAKVAFNPTIRVLSVPLAKGDTARILLSCHMKPALVPQMGLWRWTMEGIAGSRLKASSLPLAEKRQIQRQLPNISQMPKWRSRIGLSASLANTATKLSQDAAKGFHWMLTPAREIVVTHAVQQPLIIPDLTKLTSQRLTLGATYATMNCTMPLSGKSTSKLEVFAEWTDPVDPEEQEGPGEAHGKARPVEVLPGPDDKTGTIQRARHEFHDTKHRKVTYTAVATSRFTECFDKEQVASGALVTTRTSAPKTVDVLSSARPDAPRVLYVIPAFGWEKVSGAPAGSVSRRRTGGWVRVYMERPWYSSGAGEMLGVVLNANYDYSAAAKLAGVPERVDALTTKSGADPLWQAAGVSALPGPANFPGAKTEGNLRLAEVAGGVVTVAGYTPQYDAERRLWYADVRINSGAAYFPFVRLALARYQPQSIWQAGDDCKLSRVVMSDFVQLPPERTAILTFPDANTVKVEVHGPTASANDFRKGYADMWAMLEKQVPGGDPALSWAPVSPEDVQLDATRRTSVGTRTLAAVTGEIVWTKTIKLPTARGSARYRLVIKEYEWFQTEEAPAAIRAVTPPSDNRLVYADALEF